MAFTGRTWDESMAILRPETFFHDLVMDQN